MSCDQATVEQVRRILSKRRSLVEKRMIGGLSFVVRVSGAVASIARVFWFALDRRSVNRCGGAPSTPDEAGRP
jgi:hypothetical protein